jgi:hypothetical protein
LLRDIDLADPEATLPDGPLVELSTAEN